MNLAMCKALSKFKKEDFSYIIENWPAVEVTDFTDVGVNRPETLSKNDFIKSVMKIVKAKKLGRREVHHLDLLYAQRYPTKKLWTMFKLDKVPGTECSIENAPQFQRRLLQQLKFFFKVDFELSVHRRAFWMRIAIHQSHQEPVPFYVVYFPNTDFLAITGLKPIHKQSFIQAFLNVVDCHNMDVLQLKGYNLYSLFQLVHNRYSQGGLAPFKEDLREPEVPHTRSRTRSGEKRHLSDDEEQLEDVIQEDDGLSLKRQHLLERNFGTEDLPILQKIEYKLETRFRGTAYAPAMQHHTDLFKCRIKFEGPNVLEGIKNLGKAGLATLPMKDHVGKAHLLARNTFSLHMKGSAAAGGVNVLNSTALQQTPAKHTAAAADTTPATVTPANDSSRP